MRISDWSSDVCSSDLKLQPDNDDQRVGVEIVARALQAPVRQIAENAGHEGSIVVGKINDAKDPAIGFDAQNGKYVNMFKAGIIDPTKVVRTALQDAASIAGLLLTTERSEEHTSELQ